MNGADRAELATGSALVGFADLVVEACPSTTGWRVDQDDDTWIHAEHPRDPQREQGWKLHVSAHPADATGALAAVLRVVAEEPEPVSFKLLASRERLAAVNRGDAGRSQVGKFVTLYPSSDTQAVRLAVRLDRATRGGGGRGPRVPSDRRLRPDSVVSYRYGGFTPRWMQTPIGAVVAALVAPDGRLEPDHRTRLYRGPAWAADPFVAAGVVEDAHAPTLVVADRYLLASVLHSTAEGSVHLAVDLATGDRCVVKRARGEGMDGVERLRQEAALLRQLADEPTVPDLLDVVAAGGDHYLVMERVVGTSLEDVVYDCTIAGRHLPLDAVLAHATATASVVHHLHNRGLVHGDLKPPHVFVGGDGVRLVDVESLRPVGTSGADQVIGTPGYASPQRFAGAPLAVADDVYSFGAVVHFLLTAAEPSHAPDRRRLLDRPVELLRPGVPPPLVELIRSCLDPDAAQRPESFGLVLDMLAALPSEGRHSTPTSTSRPTTPTPAPEWADLADRLAQQLCDRAEPASTGLVWPTSPGRPVPRDLGDGMAGIVLALAEVADLLPSTDVRPTLAGAADWLAASEPLPGGPLPGLYVGEAGIAAALLRAGMALDDSALVELALGRAAELADLPHTSPDLYNGSAGRLRFHLLVWQATGDPRDRAQALAVANVVADAARRIDDDGVTWPIPAGHEGPDERTYYGYAHGVAGIADVLLDVVELTGERQYLPLIAGAVATLKASAIATGGDGAGGDGCSWPDRPDGDLCQPLWCHGGGGIARFLARVGHVLDDDVARTLARRAGRATAALRIVGPSQCHGLAGSVESLLEAGRGADAEEVGRLLAGFLVDPDDLHPPSPLALRDDDLMTGRAGVLRCLMRLACPDRLHWPLDPRGWRR